MKISSLPKLGLVLFWIIILSLGILVASNSKAAQFELADEDKNIVTIKENETINDNFIVIGKDLVMKGKINGDLLVISDNINLEGNVDGNIIAIGSSINSNLKGVRNVYLLGDKITFAGLVERDLNVISRSLEIKNTTNILGNFYAVVEKINQSVDSKVGHKTIIKNIEATHNASKYYYYSLLVSLLSSILVGYLLLIIWGKKLNDQKKQLAENWGSIFLKGTVVIIATIPIIALLMFSQIGINLALIILALYFIALYLSKIVIALLIGAYVVSHSNKYIQLIIGMIIVTLLNSIPVIGGLSYLVITILGFGIIIEINKIKIRN